MKKNLKIIVYLLIVSFGVSQVANGQGNANKNIEVDVCVYGGTSAGVVAAYTARKMGKTVILVEPGKHLGGMSSGGLGYTDIGNKYVVTGLARDFYRRIGSHYKKLEQWIFEPKIAEQVFNDYVKLSNFKVMYNFQIVKVNKEGNNLKEILVEHTSQQTMHNLTTIRAKVFIDCSYEGDLMARAGVSYSVGREPNRLYKESINGVEMMEGHQFPDGIDPYVVPGDAKSGVIWGITTNKLQETGTGDKKVQAYNFRITLTNVPQNRITITKPENYDPKRYELLIRLKEKVKWKSLDDIFIWSIMPNGKTDINNKGGFSTDLIGMNWDYPDADYGKRAKIWKAHEDYTKGLLYFIGNDPRIPSFIREEMRRWGYPKDEFKDNNNWTPQLYIREARRMIGELVMTQHFCEGREIASDPIAMAAYTMDSHNCDRIIVEGQVKNEGNVEVGGFGPYPISYRSIIPKEEEANNLFVPVCLSATHIAYGSIRMEPVFMVLAQSAAVAAINSIDKKIPVQQVNFTEIQQILRTNPLADGSTPDVLVDNEDLANVKINGKWKIEKNGGYGSSFLTGTSTSVSPTSVQFIPDIVNDGDYQAYYYYPKLEKAASKTIVNVYDGQKVTKKVIRKSDVKVQGQTSGEWVSLGTFRLFKGRKAHVQVQGKDADGVVVADAVLFVPLKRKSN